LRDPTITVAVFVELQLVTDGQTDGETLAMIDLHTKFEVSMITCNEDMKDNTKCKDSSFEPPFGKLKR